MTPPQRDEPGRISPTCRKHEDAGVHLARRVAGPGDDRGSGRRQRLSGPEGRPDHRRHLPGGRHRHGRAAPGQGLACSKKTSRAPPAPSANPSRRAPSSPFPRSSSRKRVADRSGFADRLLEIHVADDCGRRAGRAVRFPDAARDGGRSGTAFPESVAASRSTRPDRRGAKAAKYLFYNMGFGAAGVPAGRVQRCSPPNTFLLPRGRSGAQPPAAGRRSAPHGAGRRRRFPPRRAHRQPGLHRRRLHHRPANWRL